MRFLIGALGLALTCSVNASVVDLPELGENRLSGLPEHTDALPVRVRIDPDLNGSTVGQELTFTFRAENLIFVPDDAESIPDDYLSGKRRSNIGHFHTYASHVTDDFHVTNSFLGAAPYTEIEPGLFETTMNLPANGEWLIFLQSQYDDHSPRVRHHPQQWGSWDAAYVEVVPEPASIALLGLGSLLFLRRRQRT